jgi:hypothetical protein
MIITDNVYRFRYALDGRVKPDAVLVAGGDVEGAEREALLYIGSSEDYSGERINILSTEIVIEAMLQEPSGLPEIVTGFTEGTVVEGAEIKKVDAPSV